MTEKELSELCDGFMERARRHEECARISTELDVRLFHEKLARHYRALADETDELRGITRKIEITPRQS